VFGAIRADTPKPVADQGHSGVLTIRKFPALFVRFFVFFTASQDVFYVVMQ
jgi:hypothetical protein